MCDGCQGEVHLLKGCSGLRRKPSDDTPFYCRGCKARRDRQARATAIAEEAAAEAAEAGDGVDGGSGASGDGASSAGGESKETGDKDKDKEKGTVAAPPRKVVPRIDFSEEPEDEQRRKRREVKLKVSGMVVLWDLGKREAIIYLGSVEDVGNGRFEGYRPAHNVLRARCMLEGAWACR